MTNYTVQSLTVLFSCLLVRLSSLWVYDQAEFNDSIAPYFSASTLVQLDCQRFSQAHHSNGNGRFTEKSKRYSSGSNPLITFTLRFAFGSAVFTLLTEVGVELFGVLASLAMFSLIIGLAIQQTLGNIVNSFLVSNYVVQEIGDRIEVDGTEVQLLVLVFYQPRF